MSKITITLIDDRLNEYLKRAEELSAQGKFDHALAFLYRGLSLAEVLGDEKYLKKIKLGIIQAHHDQGQADQVIEWCDLSLKDSLEPGEAATLLEFTAFNLMRKGLYKQAEALILPLEKDSDPAIQLIAYQILGVLYLQLWKYLQCLTLEKAEEYLKKAQKLVDKEDKLMQSKIHFYTASYMIEDGLFFYAKEQLQAALDLVDSEITQIHIYNELGRASIKLMEYGEAADYLDKAHVLATRYSYHYRANYNIFYRGMLYMENCQVENACSHFLTSLYEFLRRKQYPEVSQVYFLLSQLFQAQNPERAASYLEKYNSYRNMLELRNAVDSDAVSRAKELYKWINS